VGAEQGLNKVMGGGNGEVGNAQKRSKSTKKCKKCEVYKYHHENSPEPSKS
jgi:hypothetical protein